MIVLLSLSLLALTGASLSGVSHGNLKFTFDTAAARRAPIVKVECPSGYTAVGGECIDWLRNVVTVPNNCPAGQVWVDGACREIWRTSEGKFAPIVKLVCPAGYAVIGGECIDWLRNVVTVPNNCPEGQVWVNGACRDIWRTFEGKVAPIVKLECPAGYAVVGGECIDWLRNVVTVPNNCPEGQEWVNGACRDIWRTYEGKVAPIVKLECPAGYAAVGGECIDWLRNVVTVPNNCPQGQVWVNGACRDIWRTSEGKVSNSRD